jgi:hypothetical protein
MMTIILHRHQGPAAVEIAVMLAGSIVDHIKAMSGFAPLPPAQAPRIGNPDQIGVADMAESDRLGTLLAGGTPFDGDGDLTEPGRDRGSREAWEHTAHGYCMAALCGTQGGTRGGRVTVSAAGLGLLLGLTERWGVEAGIIPSPGDVT